MAQLLTNLIMGCKCSGSTRDSKSLGRGSIPWRLAKDINNVQEYIMTDEMKKALKEYLIENLTFENQISTDIYGVNPDQIVLNIKLEGDVIATTTLYPSQF